MFPVESKKQQQQQLPINRHPARRLSNGFRSRQLLETLELSAEAIHTGIAAGVNSDNAPNSMKPEPLKPHRAISSVARIKLMAIAKRRPNNDGVEGIQQTEIPPKHVDRSHGSRKDKRCGREDRPTLGHRRSNFSSADKKAALEAQERGSGGTETMKQRRHRVGTFETGDGTTWKATIQGDIEKFMFPSLRLESLYTSDPSATVGAATVSSRIGSATAAPQPSPSADQIECLISATKMTVEWEMKPCPIVPPQPESPSNDDDKRAAFNQKLDAAEALLCDKPYDASLLLTPKSEISSQHVTSNDTPNISSFEAESATICAGAMMYFPDVVATPQLIPRLPQTRKIIKQIQRHSTRQGQIAFYADKSNLFDKWKKLQRSQQHRLPPRHSVRRYHRDSQVSDSDDSEDTVEDDDEENEQPFGELSPRSLFFHECTTHQILPEPIFSRINDVQSKRPLPSTAASSFPSVAATLVRAVRDRSHTHDLDGVVTTSNGRVVRRKRQLALHLQQFGLGDEKMRALAKSLESFHSVHVLDLSANRLTDAAVIPLLASLERASTSPVQTAPHPHQLSTTHEEEEEATSKRQHKLSEIITRVGLSKLSESTAKGCALTTLNLSQNSIGRAGYEQIARFLDCCRVLTDLNLSRTNTVSSGGNDEVLMPLTRAIQSHPSLRVVNLSDNRIGERGGELLGEMLIHPECNVVELDVTWNSICRRGAVAIGAALRSNRTLKTLKLGMNRCGDQGGEQFAAALETNSALTSLDLSRNAIGGATCVALGVFLRENRSLRVLQLRDNSLGSVGCRALLRVISMGCACEIDMSVHDASGHEATSNDGAIFDAAFPSMSSPFELHLNESPYQYAVARELLDAALLYRRCSLSDIVYIEPPPPAINAKKKPIAKRVPLVVDVESQCLREASGSKAWTLPTVGVLCAAAKFTPPDVNRLVSIAPSVFISSETDGQEPAAPYLYLIRIIQRGISPREVATLLDLGLHDLFLTTQQASVFLSRLSTELDLIEVLGRIWPCLTDGENAFEFLRTNLPLPVDQRRLMDVFGIPTIQFSTANPTGHWSLDLSDAQQRKIAVWFAILNASDARVINELHAKRTDPSQYGRGYFWRNARFNQKPIRLTYEFFDRLPHFGVLEFDYASPVRHEDIKAPIELSDEALATLIQHVGAEVCSVYMPIHKRKDLKYQLALFHLAIAGRFISSQQAHFVLQHYPKSIENCRLRILLAVHKLLIDLENFGELLDRLAAPDRLRVYHALGYLNTINPLAVDMDYDVDFEREDEKMLLRALVDLSMASTMDVIRIDSERSTVLVIYSMYQTNSVPASGRICFRYVSHQSSAPGAVPIVATPPPTASSPSGGAATAASSSSPIAQQQPTAASTGRQDWLRARQQIYRYFLCGDRLRALGDSALALSVCASPSSAPTPASNASPTQV